MTTTIRLALAAAILAALLALALAVGTPATRAPEHMSYPEGAPAPLKVELAPEPKASGHIHRDLGASEVVYGSEVRYRNRDRGLLRNEGFGDDRVLYACDHTDNSRQASSYAGKFGRTPQRVRDPNGPGDGCGRGLMPYEGDWHRICRGPNPGSPCSGTSRHDE